MKNVGMFIAFIFALSSNAYGAEGQQIVMRLSEQNNFLRVVFQSSNDALISASTVNESYSLVKIDFPDDFLFIKGSPLPENIKATQKGSSIYLNITNLEKIKTTRYKGPPRLVIDAYITGYRKAPEAAPIPGQPPAPGTLPLPVQTIEGAGLRRYSILLDAGHGGTDAGMVSGQFKESTLTLSVCAVLAKHIGNKARRVTISRKDDTAMSIEQRLNDINKYRPNVFISIHVSASGTFGINTSSFPAVISNTGSGMAYSTAYVQAAYIEKSRALAQALVSAFNEKFQLQPVYRELPIPILSGTAGAAVMIELPNPASFTYNNSSINSISDAIIKAVSEHEKK
ncbi:MAG: N-acetylmuramoyl-L-alanine amidase [Nitrospirae bacterium]|nr:N-acetylmuramoyl-L-alanine amidase [Nitrospirota bacterium]